MTLCEELQYYTVEVKDFHWILWSVQYKIMESPIPLQVKIYLQW